MCILNPPQVSASFPTFPFPTYVFYIRGPHVSSHFTSSPFRSSQIINPPQILTSALYPRPLRSWACCSHPIASARSLQHIDRNDIACELTALYNIHTTPVNSHDTKILIYELYTNVRISFRIYYFYFPPYKEYLITERQGLYNFWCISAKGYRK